MLQNAYFLAKIGADTAENEQHFAENLPKIGNYHTGPPGPAAAGRKHATKQILKCLARMQQGSSSKGSVEQQVR